MATKALGFVVMYVRIRESWDHAADIRNGFNATLARVLKARAVQDGKWLPTNNAEVKAAVIKAIVEAPRETPLNDAEKARLIKARMDKIEAACLRRLTSWVTVQWGRVSGRTNGYAKAHYQKMKRRDQEQEAAHREQVAAQQAAANQAHVAAQQAQAALPAQNTETAALNREIMKLRASVTVLSQRNRELAEREPRPSAQRHRRQPQPDVDLDEDDLEDEELLALGVHHDLGPEEEEDAMGFANRVRQANARAARTSRRAEPPAAAGDGAADPSPRAPRASGANASRRAQGAQAGKKATTPARRR